VVVGTGLTELESLMHHISDKPNQTLPYETNLASPTLTAGHHPASPALNQKTVFFTFLN